MTPYPTETVDRLVRDLARLRGVPEQVIRLDYGLIPRAEPWAEEREELS